MTETNAPSAEGSVGWIAVAPVKSLALAFLPRVDVTETGIAIDRRFALIDPAGRIFNGKRNGRLATILPAYDAAAEILALTFPDATCVSAPVDVTGAPDNGLLADGRPAYLMDSRLSGPLSEIGRVRLRLVRFAAPGLGVDRQSKDGTVSLLTSAALASLAAEGGESEPLDPRRFRMTFGIDRLPAHAEDGWLGRRVRIGQAVVEVRGNVGRCAVTTQNPESGEPDFDTLRILARTRAEMETTEPLPFGVWAAVVEPGPVSLGDPVRIETL